MSMRFLSLVLVLITGGLALGAIDNLPKFPTYSASTTFTPPSTPTDLCKVSGSATRTIRVTQVMLTSTQSTAGINNFFLVKRSTDDTGGGPMGMPAVAHHSGGPAASASTARYVTNPTLGTLVGIIKTFHVFAPAPASVAAGTVIVWDYDQDGGSYPILLRGTGEVLAVNFNGAALPTGLSVNCNFLWNESD